MMGAGIAYSCARAGMQVVLKDVAQENADKGKAYSEKLNAKAVERGKLDRGEVRASCSAGSTRPTTTPTSPAATWSSRRSSRTPRSSTRSSPRPPSTSTPTRCCAPTPRRCRSPSSRPASTGRRTSSGCTSSRPVDKMPLVEIIRGAETSDVALAKAYDVVQQIRKTPIVVNDSRGFYTSRVIGFMVNEGLAMLAEGVHPVSLERAATQAGYPVGTAAALRRAQHGADGQDRQGHPRRRRARRPRLRGAPRRRPSSRR